MYNCQPDSNWTNAIWPSWIIRSALCAWVVAMNKIHQTMYFHLNVFPMIFSVEDDVQVHVFFAQYLTPLVRSRVSSWAVIADANLLSTTQGLRWVMGAINISLQGRCKRSNKGISGYSALTKISPIENKDQKIPWQSRVVYTGLTSFIWSVHYYGHTIQKEVIRVREL